MSMLRLLAKYKGTKVLLFLLAVVLCVAFLKSTNMVFEQSNAKTQAKRTALEEFQEEELMVESDESELERTDMDMDDRRQVMEDQCKNHVGQLNVKHSKKGYYVQPFDFYVCLVAKVASTFWSRVLYQMHHTDPVESPFDVRVQKAYAGIHSLNAHDNFPKLDIANISTKLLFVREPFGRLFSAYVDKLIPPNPVFWKSWGQRATLEFRHSSQKKFVCGNDTTFSEFISFATKRGSLYDVHLVPIYKVCAPCSTQFTTVGKMESFERDAKYVMARLDIPEKQIGFDRMKADQEDDALTDSTGGAFSSEWLRSTLRCITLEAAAQRVWRKLQIRGFISWRQRLQLTEDQKENLNMTQMVRMLVNAKHLSTNQTELKIQKKQAFLEAYSTIKSIQIQELLTVYGPDFKLFGYDIGLVDKLLEANRDFHNTNALDWTQDWDLSPVLGS